MFSSTPFQRTDKNSERSAISSSTSYPHITTVESTDQHLLNEPHATLNPRAQRQPTSFSLGPKLGWWTYLITIFSSIALLASVGFLLFLWLSWDDNRTWRAIAHNNRMTQAVTLSSVLLRTAVSIQAGLAASMLAGLAIERQQVKFRHLPIVSTLRSNASGPLALSWYMLPDKKRLLLPFFTILLCLTSLTLQFSSTILVSDIRQGWILGSEISTDLKAGLINGSASKLVVGTAASSRWQTKAQQYPTFAEYREDNAIKGIDGLSDTGTTIRAYLPFTDATTRSTISDYRGPAAVVDTRALCMRPNLTDLTWTSPGAAVILPLFVGMFSVPDEFNDRPANLSSDTSWRINPSTYNTNTRNCTVPQVFGPEWTGDPSYFYHTDDWAISLCHLDVPNDILIPEFYDMDKQTIWAESSNPRNTFLVLNQTVTPDGSTYTNLFESAPLRNEAEGEWLHLFFNATTNSAGVVKHQEARVSLSLCSTAVDGLLSNITATSSSNRTEPSPKVINDVLTFADIRRQLGQDPSISSSDRGILDMQGENWVLKRSLAGSVATSGGELEYIGEAVETNDNGIAWDTPATSILFTTNVGTEQSFNDIYADANLAMLFQEILKTGGSVPFALQSAVTILTGMAYYDQAPLFDQTFQANHTLLEQRQIPGGQSKYLAAPAGLLPGLLAVLCVLVAHCATVSVITWMFFSGTTISTLDNMWQPVAQLQSTPADGYIAHAALANDKDVNEWIRGDGYDDDQVGVAPSANGGTEIVGLRPRRINTGLKEGEGESIQLQQLRSSTTTFSEEEVAEILNARGHSNSRIK